MKWKADLHVHSGEDPHDLLEFSAEMLIDAAAQLNVNVLAITCHGRVLRSDRLDRYARNRGLLLVPGVELLIEGKHVVVLNPSAAHLRARTFAALRAAGRQGAFMLAPHPFYPHHSCLGRKLEEHIDLFDGIEYCSLYLRGINPNRKAVEAARRFGLPLVGTSDTHVLPYSDSTVSWLQVETPTVDAVLAAMRQGDIELDTRPKPMRQTLKMLDMFVREIWRTKIGGKA